ncbi:MAG: SRPBCC family protein [Nocardioides sp.]
MPSVERTVTVNQPMAKVWAYLSDFTTTEEWDPPTVRTTRQSGDGEVGTTYLNVSTFLGKETEVQYVVTEHETGARLQLAGDAGSLKLLDTLTFESSTNDGVPTTTVTYHAEFTPHGAAKLAEPLMPAGLKLLADKVAASLEEHLTKL